MVSQGDLFLLTFSEGWDFLPLKMAEAEEDDSIKLLSPINIANFPNFDGFGDNFDADE